MAQSQSGLARLQWHKTKVEKQNMRTELKNNRNIYDIAAEIRRDWKKVNFAAAPYLSAMSTIGDIGESYGRDNGNSIVRYFLSNSSTWRGETAKRIKAELKAMLAMNEGGAA